jgi:hypothetical protein
VYYRIVIKNERGDQCRNFVQGVKKSVMLSTTLIGNIETEVFVKCGASTDNLRLASNIIKTISSSILTVSASAKLELLKRAIDALRNI